MRTFSVTSEAPVPMEGGGLGLAARTLAYLPPTYSTCSPMTDEQYHFIHTIDITNRPVRVGVE